LRTDWGRGRRL